MTSKITVIRNEHSSSIELGRTAHGGTLKIYLDPANLPEMEKRIDNLIAARAYLIRKLGEEGTT